MCLCLAEDEMGTDLARIGVDRGAKGRFKTPIPLAENDQAAIKGDDVRNRLKHQIESLLVRKTADHAEERAIAQGDAIFAGNRLSAFGLARKPIAIVGSSEVGIV